MGFEKVRHIDLPKICDPRGNLSFLENGGVVPFPIARTYWVYDVPGGKKRFGHAFHRQEELIISLSGSFDIVLNDGSEERCAQRRVARATLPHGTVVLRTLCATDDVARTRQFLDQLGGSDFGVDAV
ncbi:putative uncharacterized protein [Prevotella sp. CAG:279]|nr:putative uncharacterized protein [Prevotella sp. CAG:279]